jgi:hypothetical protein
MTKASRPRRDHTKTSSKTVTQARHIQHSAQQHEQEQMSLTHPGFWNPSLPSKRQHENRVSSASFITIKTNRARPGPVGREPFPLAPWISRLRNAFTRFLRHHGSIVFCRDLCRGSGIGFVAFKRRRGATVRARRVRSFRKFNAAPSVCEFVIPVASCLSFQLSDSIRAQAVDR